MDSDNFILQIFVVLFFSKIGSAAKIECINEDFSDDYDTEVDLEVLSRERRALNFYRTGQKLQSEMSSTLDDLLGTHYNKRIRPNYGGPPVPVELNLSIRSIVSLKQIILQLHGIHALGVVNLINLELQDQGTIMGCQLELVALFWSYNMLAFFKLNKKLVIIDLLCSTVLRTLSGTRSLVLVGKVLDWRRKSLELLEPHLYYCCDLAVVRCI